MAAKKCWKGSGPFSPSACDALPSSPGAKDPVIQAGTMTEPLVEMLRLIPDKKNRLPGCLVPGKRICMVQQGDIKTGPLQGFCHGSDDLLEHIPGPGLGAYKNGYLGALLSSGPLFLRLVRKYGEYDERAMLLQGTCQLLQINVV